MINHDMVGRRMETRRFEYTWREAALYALGIGIGTDELQFLYENYPGGMRVFPTFCVVPLGAVQTVLCELELDPLRSIHGEHCVKLFRPIPPAATLVTEPVVTAVYDKGKAALIKVRSETRTDDGIHLFDNEATIYYVGGGGFGGDRGPKSEQTAPPDGVEPDFRISYDVPLTQAALYRLSGDDNPLHIDPQLASLAGFDRPILHGLCTFGYAARAVVHGACEDDETKLKEFKVRFSDVVLPGETLTTEGWRDPTRNDRYIIQTRTDRAVVLTNAAAVLHM